MLVYQYIPNIERFCPVFDEIQMLKEKKKKKKKKQLCSKFFKWVWYFLTPITKTCFYNFDPFKLHFYIVKLEFTGVYIILLFLLKIIDCGYSLEPPRRGGSNEYPQSIFWAEIWKISEFLIWFFFSIFGDEIFYIFKKACFRNAVPKYRVWSLGTMLLKSRVYHAIIIFQIWKGSSQQLLRYECLKSFVGKL